MDNVDIQHCVEKDSKELAKIYAGVLTIDDVTHMNSSLEMFRQFLISSLLSNKIQNFPIGFIEILEVIKVVEYLGKVYILTTNIMCISSIHMVENRWNTT